MKKILTEIVLILFGSAIICTIGMIVMLELTKERSTSVYKFVWMEKEQKWEITPEDIKGKTLKSPYGFLHGVVTRGRSYTLVVPHSLLGNKEVRVHFWDGKP